MSITPKVALQKAIEFSGGHVATSVKLGLHKTAAYKWGDECPSDRVLQVAELTDWKITPHDLRPDLYPNATDALPTIPA